MTHASSDNNFLHCHKNEYTYKFLTAVLEKRTVHGASKQLATKEPVEASRAGEKRFDQ